jgi:hypothetical protein
MSPRRRSSRASRSQTSHTAPAVADTLRHVQDHRYGVMMITVRSQPSQAHRASPRISPLENGRLGRLLKDQPRNTESHRSQRGVAATKTYSKTTEAQSSQRFTEKMGWKNLRAARGNRRLVVQRSQRGIAATKGTPDTGDNRAIDAVCGGRLTRPLLSSPRSPGRAGG